MTKPSDILRGARDLIKKGWTKNVSARTADDKSVVVDDSRACKFCSLGALDRICIEKDMSLFEKEDATYFLRSAVYGESATLVGKITEWNDNPHTHKKDVVKKFNEAIKLAKKCKL